MLAALLLLVACSTGAVIADPSAEGDADTDADADADTDADADADTDADIDYREAGPYEVVVTSGETEVNGCTIGWDRYEPSTGGTETVAILTHGWTRNRSYHVARATNWASWGATVITTDPCHLDAWDVNQAQVAVDLQALGDALGLEHIVYVGHSAGGLASFLAAEADPHAVAYLGFDPADVNDLGIAAAAAIDVPAHGLIALSGPCNIQNNAVPWFDTVADGGALRVDDADHCSFEDPTDWGCTSFCSNPNASRTDDEIGATITGLSTAFVVWQTGADPDGERWWTPGTTYYDELDASGAITAL